MAVTRFLPAVAALVAWGLSASAAPAESPGGKVVAIANARDGESIRHLLSGNSIVHPNFGCAFYRPDGTTLQVGRSGLSVEGRWRVRSGLYYSTGMCGGLGCRITIHYPSLTFRRVDGKYEQPALLIRGNYCEKNGLFS